MAEGGMFVRRDAHRVWDGDPLAVNYDRDEQLSPDERVPVHQTIDLGNVTLEKTVEVKPTQIN